MTTYISLFSSAGVGCYGFQLERFECVATNEIIPRRLDIQRANGKCRFETGYIDGDISLDETKERLYEQVKLWEQSAGIDRIDVVIATPPCQGMSVANHKKHGNEIVRNSLVVESIRLIQKIRPRFFVFENVSAFMRSACTDTDGNERAIGEAIRRNLGQMYSFTSRVINFKNYGACSSRQRTLVIGVAAELSDEISPYELFPSYLPEKTLREVIGDLPRLKRLGEISRRDIYHAFRAYPEHMRSWISELKEGESAFDNADDLKKPHQIINGEIVINKRKNGDKYRRQFWDKPGPCIHTRNDQLASQNTIHPEDDRVFSIREIMRMMTVPDSFNWAPVDEAALNRLTDDEKRVFLSKNEINIRQTLGEAVPTAIFQQIARNIRLCLGSRRFKQKTALKLARDVGKLGQFEICEYIAKNPLELPFATLARVAEMANAARTDNAAYYTSKSLITEIVNLLPDFDKESIRILEPAVGVGNFIPILAKKYEQKKVELCVVDIDEQSLEILKQLLPLYNLPPNFNIKMIHGDFLLLAFEDKFDLIVGNPPFGKPGADKRNFLPLYRSSAKNKTTSNLSSFFLSKSLKLANHIALVMPKFLLNTPDFAADREMLSSMRVEGIIDFGEKGFPGVLVETIAVLVNTTASPQNTRVISLPDNLNVLHPQAYIMDKAYPYWLIYRNSEFDRIAKKLVLGFFDVFRDRQITNKLLQDKGAVRVLKSRNISDDGTTILDIPKYDAYISEDAASKLAVTRFLNEDEVYLAPNMTYKPRVMRKPHGVLVNGSVAILYPRSREAWKHAALFDGKCGDPVSPSVSDAQLRYFSTPEYRAFYRTARNNQTRSLNIDSCSVFFFGLLKPTKQ